MTNLIKLLSSLTFLLFGTLTLANQGLSVITITTDDPEDYVEWLTDNQPIFQKAAGDTVIASGICSPMAGGRTMNEHYVWSFHPSTSAMLSGNQYNDPDSQRAIRKISSKRELVRRDMWTIAKGDELAEAGSTAANYNVISRTTNVNEYVEGLTALENAAAKNGHPNITFALYVASSAGDRAGTVMVSVQAPTSNELGAFLDQRQSSWMAAALQSFDTIRTPIEDFVMQCTTLTVNS